MSVEAEVIVGAEVADATSLIRTFSIRFLSTSSSEQYFRSGNPGYIASKPLLVAEKGASGGMSVYKYGYRLSSGKSDGECLGSTESEYSARAPTLLFGQNVKQTCWVSLTLAQLKSYCENSEYTSKKIFTSGDFI